MKTIYDDKLLSKEETMEKRRNADYVVCFSFNAFFGTPYHVYLMESVCRGALRPDYALTEEEFLAFGRECEEKGDTMVSNIGRHIGIEYESAEQIVRMFRGLEKK